MRIFIEVIIIEIEFPCRIPRSHKHLVIRSVEKYQAVKKTEYVRQCICSTDVQAAAIGETRDGILQGHACRETQMWLNSVTVIGHYQTGWLRDVVQKQICGQCLPVTGTYSVHECQTSACIIPFM